MYYDLDKQEKPKMASKAIGVAWASRQCEELLAAGAPGIHFYTMNRSHATQRIFEHLRESSVKGLLPTTVEQSLNQEASRSG